MSRENNGDFKYNPKLKSSGHKQQFTKEEIEELVKCKKDPVYFIKNYMKIKDVDSHVLVPFEMYDYQEEFLDTCFNNRQVICMMARRNGKTTTVGGLMLWSTIFNSNYTCAILANKEDTAKEILSIFKDAYEGLPKFMQQGVLSWAKESVKFENGSRIIIGTTTATALSGFAVNLLYVDEFSKVQPNVANEFYTSIYPTIASGKTTKIIITSTPMGLNMFYKMFSEAEKGENGFVALSYDWSYNPRYDKTWKETTVKALGQREFDQEFGIEFLGSSNTLICGPVLRRLTFITPQISSDDVYIYHAPNPTRKYIICVDVSRGLNLDYSAAVVFDVSEYPIRVCATYRSNNISPNIYPSIIEKIARKYNDAYVFVEINDNGQQVADILYNDLEYENVLSASFHDSNVGIRTTKSTKRIGCSNLKDLIENDKMIINDFNIKEELSTFVQQKNTYRAEEGRHDDLVMCLVFLSYFLHTTQMENISDINFRKFIREQKQETIQEVIMPFMGTFDDYLPDIELNEEFKKGGWGDVWWQKAD